MKKLILLVILLNSVLLTNAQSSLQYSYFRLLNFQESITDIRVLSRFGSADYIPPLLLGSIDEVRSDTLFFKVLYKERVSTGSGSSVSRDDTFYNVAIPAGIHYLNISGSTMRMHTDGQPNDTFWNETDSTFVLYPVGINDLSKNVPHIAVYPNPANNILFFKQGLVYKEIHVYNSIGQLIATYPYNNTKSIDIGSLAKGSYFLKLTGKKEETLGRTRFIKTAY